MKSKHPIDQKTQENGEADELLQEDQSKDKVSDNFSPATMQIIQDQ